MTRTLALLAAALLAGPAAAQDRPTEEQLFGAPAGAPSSVNHSGTVRITTCPAAPPGNRTGVW